MAKKQVKKKANPKNYQIKWKKEDVQNLEKAVSTFNKNVKRLKKARKNIDFIPEEIDFQGTRELIKNRAELNRVIKSLSRFKGKEAFKKVTLPSGVEMTAWEKREIGYQKGVATRRIKKMMEAERKANRKYKSERYNELKTALESVENVYYVTGAKFEKAKSRIENYGSQDYDIRIASIYKENYLSMLERNFQEVEGYEELVQVIERMNPLTFYNRLKSNEYGEKLKDIRFMYDTNEYEEMFNQLLGEFQNEIEQIQENEEGE